MNLNEIELPAFVIANLYPSSIVEPGRSKEPVPANKTVTEDKIAAPARPEHLGNNRQHILVVVDHEDVQYIPDPELELLTGILTACKLGMDDIALVNRNNSRDKGYKDYYQDFRSRIILLFDCAPDSIGLPMSFPHFQPQLFNNITYLFSPSLQELGNDKVLKSKLWLCLKKIFSL